MIRLMSAAGDRLLGLVAPRTTASAGCPPDPWTQYCYCRNYAVYVKSCHYTPRCTSSCGSCHSSYISCS